jgi:N6-adenosine-specific RNA methylase IME4
MKIDREALALLPFEVRAEISENAERLDFKPSEINVIRQLCEDAIRKQAKARQGRPGEPRSGKFPESARGQTRDKIGALVNVSGKTIEKIAAVVSAAEAEPEKFGKLVEYMDETGSVDRAFKRLKIERAKDHHAKTIEHGCTVTDLVALAASGKRFGVIYADPPWPWDTWGGDTGKIRSSCDNHYNTSPLAEIAALPVAQLAADDCALLLWCTWPHIAIGTHTKIIEAWRFRLCTLGFDWIKQTASGDLHNGGMGYYTRSNAEPCLLAIKGSPLRLNADVHQIVMAPVGEHSAKPEDVRRRIERLFGGPYLELYGRKLVPGWSVYGNEVPPSALGVAAA